MEVLSASDVCQIPFLTFISLGLAISFLCLSLSLSPSLFHMKPEIGRYVSEESNYNNLIIQSEKKSYDSGLFCPLLGKCVATKEYCSICLEKAFISKEFGMKILIVVAAAED